jgi:hypothetical protein
MSHSEPNLTGAAHDVTALLHAWSDGDVDARDRLVTLIYQELRRRAAAQVRRERHDHTLQRWWKADATCSQRMDDCRG